MRLWLYILLLGSYNPGYHPIYMYSLTLLLGHYCNRTQIFLVYRISRLSVLNIILGYYV